MNKIHGLVVDSNGPMRGRVAIAADKASWIANGPMVICNGDGEEFGVEIVVALFGRLGFTALPCLLLAGQQLGVSNKHQETVATLDRAFQAMQTITRGTIVSDGFKRANGSLSNTPGRKH